MDRLLPFQASLLASRNRWPEDVHVWRLDCADHPTWLTMLAELTPDEQTRAARFLRPVDQARFISARATLRALLATVSDAPPRLLRFETGPYGRPSLTDYPNCSFNVSHSGAYALIAISTTRTVGIDVESIDTNLDWQALARRVCTRDEWAAIARLPAARQTPQFFRCWTAKEALLKALGVGIGEALQMLSVDLTTESPAQTSAQEHAGEQRPTLLGDKAAGADALRFHWIDDIATADDLPTMGHTATGHTATRPLPDAGADIRLHVADRVRYSACVAYSATAAE